MPGPQLYIYPCRRSIVAVKKTMMASDRLVSLLLRIAVASFLLPSIANEAAAGPVESLTACFRSHHILNYTTPQSSSFSSVWLSSLQNLRFAEPNASRPSAIVLPSSPSQVRASWRCIRSAASFAAIVRSGGHSYEGLSSTAQAPFVIIELMNLNTITVNVAKRFAWVEAGATVGELYHAISASTSSYGFSAGTCATIGLGGHIGGGGFGMLSRKYGVAADHVLEAQVVLANGTFLSKASASDKDLFWALRGGGGGSWGIVVAWKLRLVPVPPLVTTFNVWKTGKDAIADLAFHWQTAAPAAPPELFIAMYIAGIASGSSTDMGSSIYGQYWGNINDTVSLINNVLPALGITAASCKQGDWIQAAADIAGVSSPSALLSRQQASKNYFKAKSDYVNVALPKAALLGAFDVMMQNTQGFMIFEPYGGVMEKISSDAIAFPHRAGRLYMIQYLAVWTNDTGSADNAMIEWVRKLYSYMGSYVVQSPVRAAYVNYIDIDLGNGAAAGPHYFGGNFARLVAVKNRVDPTNLFRNPQSVPTSF